MTGPPRLSDDFGSGYQAFQGDALARRDALGRRVREVWVEWAKTQPNPKSSWLVPYDDLSEADKEADRCIGSALHGDGIETGMRMHAAMRRTIKEMVDGAKLPFDSLPSVADSHDAPDEFTSDQALAWAHGWNMAIRAVAEVELTGATEGSPTDG